MLQTVAILVLDDTSAINVFSILMSIVVVASKGYLVAYSLHRPTFAFNYTCIAADAFNLFATATWLFVLVGGSGSSLEAHPLWWWPAIVGMASCAVGGFGLLTFSMFDDHLKVRSY